MAICHDDDLMQVEQVVRLHYTGLFFSGDEWRMLTF